MRKLLFTLFYYAVFAPCAWVLQRFYDPLDRKWDAGGDTYFDYQPDIVGETDRQLGKQRRTVAP